MTHPARARSIPPRILRSRLAQTFPPVVRACDPTSSLPQRGDIAVSGRAPAGRVFRVGWFFSSTPLEQMAGPDPIIPVGKALVQALRALGYVEGHNLVLERRSAEGKFERIPEIAAELVSRNPDVIITGSGNKLAQELQRVTKSVPIVMPDSDDPVGAGLVESLGRPGTNVTGFSADAGPGIEAKRLQLLRRLFQTPPPGRSRHESSGGSIGTRRSAAFRLAVLHAEHFAD